MTECKHGLPTRFCVLCSKQVQIETTEPKHPRCCNPTCDKASFKQVAGLPLCPAHYHRLQTQIAWVYAGELELPDDDDCWVYFVRIDQVIKIGISKNPRSRIHSFGNFGHDIEVLALERGDYALEKRLHRRFKEHQASVGYSKELFHPAPELLEYIESGRRCSLCSARSLPGRVVCAKNHRAAGDFADVEALIGRPIGRLETSLA